MRSHLKTILLLVLLTFGISMFLNIGSNSLLTILSLPNSFLMLIIIIVLGVVFDVIGVAATAGREEPFHAMASNRVPGAKQAIWLVRSADRVAALCNDVIGDITGTLSGAVGAAIVFQLSGSSTLSDAFMSTLVVALVASVTVGGKAFFKGVAVKRSRDILLLTGHVLFSLEKIGLRSKTASKTQKKR